MPPVPTEQIALGQFKHRVMNLNVDPMIMIREAAKIAGVHAETLKNEARRGKLKLLRISQRKIGVRESELNRYLSSNVYASEAA